MEELKDINFQALIEGQDYEKALRKIVSRSTIFHTQTHTYSQVIKVRIRMLKMLTIFLKVRSFQGFSSFHYTPLEVLLAIEQCQKRLQRVFNPGEIKAGVLKELLMETDYDIVTTVSTYLSKISKILHKC